MEQICLRSFLAHGYEVHLYHYEPIKSVPHGTQQRDASEILPNTAIFRDTAGSLTSFADQFRLHLLERKGGWWFDMDFLSARIMPEPTELRFASTWQFAGGQCAVNSAIWCKPGDPHVVELRRRCDAIIAKGSPSFGSTGPHILNPLIAERALQKNVAPWWEFCPFPWTMTHHMAYCTNIEWLKERARLIKHFTAERIGSLLRPAYVRQGTRAIHWHNEIWRRKGLDRDALYHPRSAYGRAQREFGFEDT
jgi:hypothetical protein